MRNGGGIYGFTLDGTYEASLVLLDKIWSKDNFPVDGDFIMAIPARDLLYITGSNNKDAIKKLRDMLSEQFGIFDHQISDKLFIRKNDHWEIFED